MDIVNSNEWENNRPAEIKARHFVNTINSQIATKVSEEFGEAARVSAELIDIDSRDMFLEGGSLDPDMARLGDEYDRITASENIVADITIRYPKGSDAIRDYIISLCSTAAPVKRGAKTNYGSLVPDQIFRFLAIT